MNEQFINDLSKELAKLGTIHSVGEEWISYTGKIPSGGIPYCGQEVTRETYSALWSWVQAQGLVKAESEWQSIASNQNGNVPFYSSGNGTDTFRMPKLVGYVKGASSQSESGAYTAEGLPNIEGVISNQYFKSPIGYSQSGALSLSGEISNCPGTSSSLGYSKINFDASKSNSIYGASDHVTPETSCVLFGVYAFGTVSNPNDLNVSNLAADVDSIKTSYLPLAGGTMTGALGVKSTTSLVEPEITVPMTENKWSPIAYRIMDANGTVVARMQTYYQNTGEVQLQLRVNNGTAENALRMTTNGALQWMNNEVERVMAYGFSDSQFYQRFASGLQIIGGSGTGSGGKDFTFVLPFSQTPYVMATRISGSSTTSTNYYVWARGTTTTTVNIYSSGDTGYRWFAIGKWK